MRTQLFVALRRVVPAMVLCVGLDQGMESVLSREARRDVSAAPATAVSVTQVLRSTKPIINENQPALLLAGQELLAHDRVRANRQFPELVYLQS